MPEPTDVMIHEGKGNAEFGPGRDDTPLRTDGAHEVEGGAAPSEEFGGTKAGGSDGQGTSRHAVDDGGEGPDGEGVDGHVGRHRPPGLLGPLGEVEVLVFLGRLLGENGHVPPSGRGAGAGRADVWLVSAGEGRCGDGGRGGGIGTTHEGRADEATGAATGHPRGGVCGRGKHGSGRSVENAVSSSPIT